MRCAVILLILCALSVSSVARAQEPEPDGPPFSLPFADPPGPNTWLYQQHYGNTTASFNFGDVWYMFGQGMHFGVDFRAPCGTPVLAIASGIVTYVDAEGFGAGPHNLVLSHPGTGYASLYGHLQSQPLFKRGDAVTRGQPIALTGDPDGSCESRPHLHLEIRHENYQIAYNPVPLIDANWHMIASVGPNNHNFQQDLDHPRRWMKLETQPEIAFSGNTLNRYLRPWPPKLELRAPVNPPAYRHLDPLPEDAAVTLTPVSPRGWNLGAWWDPLDLEAVYLIDAGQGDHPSRVYRVPLDGSPRLLLGPAPPPLVSPDGTISVERLDGGIMRITRRADDMAWDVDTGGNYPAVSPDGTRLLWEIVYGEIVPGNAAPGVAVIVSNLDGSDAQRATNLTNGYSLWLDSHRLLLVRRIQYTAETRLFLLDLDAASPEPVLLGSYRSLQGLEVAPGGGRIAYMLLFQDDPAASGVYVQPTLPGAEAVKMDFFGAYQWRDDRSLFTLSFDAATDAHALGVADALTGAQRWLTDPDEMPIRVANGEWSVSPDGTRIVFVDPADYGLYLLAVGAQ